MAVAGQDNSALKIESVGPPTAAAALPADGTAAYETACSACHGAGIAGAPKVGDKGAWGPRIAQGKDTLYNHAIQGFNGKTGVMPAKGGRADWPDDLIKQAVDHMRGAEQVSAHSFARRSCKASARCTGPMERSCGPVSFRRLADSMSAMVRATRNTR